MNSAGDRNRVRLRGSSKAQSLEGGLTVLRN